MPNITLIILLIIFLLLFSLIIIGITIKPKPPQINIIPTKTGSLNKNCLIEKTSCITDDDCMQNCTEASEGESIVCKSIPDIPGLTSTQKNLLSFNNQNDQSMIPPKFCVPEKAKLDCNVSTGGIPIFSGWGAGDTMGFDCMCSYPIWASSRKCQEINGGIYCEGNCLLNPNICKGGTFNWDLTKNPQEPNANLCTCSEGDLLMVTNEGLPICVPENIQNFYEDVELSTNKGGVQNLIPIDNIAGITLTSSGPTDQTTTCFNNSNLALSTCPLPSSSSNNPSVTAVCDPESTTTDFCCTSQYPVFDNLNRRCLQRIFNCNSFQSLCSGGCCSTINGTCCNDGKSCCPENFPICDTERNSCNPKPTPVLKNENTSTNYKQCSKGQCPFLDAMCSPDGEYCCPIGYPIYDSVLGCRKPG
jgi:hypothetical protein